MVLKLNEVKEWKRKHFLLKDIGDFEEEVYDFIHDKYSMNTCDKCNTIHDTEQLVWITTEDFEPKENEIVPEELYEKYDALCEECYMKLIIKK